MQEALRVVVTVGEDRQSAVRPRRRGDRGDPAEAAVDPRLVAQDLVSDVERRLDLRVVERDLVVHPLVVDLGTCGTQDDVLDPVGGRPAGRVTGLDAGAPRLGVGVVRRDRVGQGEHLVPRLGDRVALLREDVRVVPDERLHVRAEGSRVERAVDRAVVLPRRSEELVHVRLGLGRGRDDRVGEVGDDRVQQSRLREVGDVGGVARLDPDEQLRLELSRTLVHDGRTRALLELVVGLLLVDLLHLDDRGVDGHLGAGEVAVGGVVLAALGDVAGGLGGAGFVATRRRCARLIHGRCTGREHESETRPRREGKSPPRVSNAHVVIPSGCGGLVAVVSCKRLHTGLRKPYGSRCGHDQAIHTLGAALGSRSSSKGHARGGTVEARWARVVENTTSAGTGAPVIMSSSIVAATCPCSSAG